MTNENAVLLGTGSNVLSTGATKTQSHVHHQIESDESSECSQWRENILFCGLFELVVCSLLPLVDNVSSTHLPCRQWADGQSARFVCLYKHCLSTH